MYIEVTPVDSKEEIEEFGRRHRLFNPVSPRLGFVGVAQHPREM
jgi:hypothetical protein